MGVLQIQPAFLVVVEPLMVLGPQAAEDQHEKAAQGVEFVEEALCVAQNEKVALCVVQEVVVALHERLPLEVVPTMTRNLDVAKVVLIVTRALHVEGDALNGARSHHGVVVAADARLAVVVARVAAVVVDARVVVVVRLVLLVVGLWALHLKMVALIGVEALHVVVGVFLGARALHAVVGVLLGAGVPHVVVGVQTDA